MYISSHVGRYPIFVRACEKLFREILAGEGGNVKEPRIFSRDFRRTKAALIVRAQRLSDARRRHMRDARSARSARTLHNNVAILALRRNAVERN